jgi:hypothetical protein
MLKRITPSDRRLRQALVVWFAFIIMAVLINGTIPFLLGYDLHAWTYSTAKIVLFSLLIYAGMFLFIPLILVNGWRVVRQPGFLVPVLIATSGIVLWWPVNRFAAGLVIPVLAYLHWRYDLSELGFRSCGWKGDIAAIILFGLLSGISLLARGIPNDLDPAKAFLAAIERLFANPASTVENLFYFGFLAESLSNKAGRWLTPMLIALMYTLHEMSNPEYWYDQTSFGLVFLGIAATTAIYLWRRNIVVIWLGDGLNRFITRII